MKKRSIWIWAAAGFLLLVGCIFFLGRSAYEYALTRSLATKAMFVEIALLFLALLILFNIKKRWIG